MDIKELIGDFVTSLQYNGNFIRYDYGDKGWQNLMSDEKNFKNAVVFFDTPLTNDFLLFQSGLIQDQYFVKLLVMLKSEQEWTPTQHNDNCIIPCRTISKKLLYKIMSSKEVKSISNAKGVEFTNLFDVNCSGLFLTFNIIPYSTESNCS